MKMMSSSYWDKRKHFRYYREIQRLVKKYSTSECKTLLDVGSAIQSGALLLQREELAKYKRTSIEQDDVGCRMADVRHLFCDLNNCGLSQLVDVVGLHDITLCCQCLEHLQEPKEICSFLKFVTNRLLIISVPYKWPAGREEGHLHDPVDEAKVSGWMGEEPTESLIVEDLKHRRLICVYDRTKS